MKRIFYGAVFVALSLSCSKKDDGSLSETSYEDAIASQTIKFQLESLDGNVRNIELTDYIENDAINRQMRNWGSFGSSEDLLIPFDPDTETLITYSAGTHLPEEQSFKYHHESVALHFGKIEDVTRINTGEYGRSGYFSNELFRKELLKVGKADPLFVNFSYQQTYLFTSGFPKGIDMTIDKIEGIAGHENKIYVSGSFSGATFYGNSPGVNISNGSFKVILENQQPN